MTRRIGLLLALVLALLGATALPGVADNAIEDEINATKSQIDSLLGQIDAAEQRASSTRQLLVQTQERVAAANAEFNEAAAQLRSITDAIASAQVDIDAKTLDLIRQENVLARTRNEIEGTRDQVKSQAVEMYMLGGAGAFSVSLEAASAQELAVGREYVGALIADNEVLLERLETLREAEEKHMALLAAERQELEEYQGLLDVRRGEARLWQSQVEEKRQALEGELVWQQTELASVLNEIAFFEQEIDAQEAEQARLLTLLEEQQRKGGSAPGDLYWPTDGRMTSPFGQRLHPILGYTRLHAGVDISAPSGTPIVAAGGGTVILAGWYGGYGNAVIIDHGGGMATLYAHQSEIGVGKGTQVGVGDVIGRVGSTGLSTGPHLHFEVRINGSPVDPMPYF